MDDSCQVFLNKLASKDPTPGGGGAAALVGAVGTALGHMVCELTIGKKKYADVEEEIREQMLHCEEMQKELFEQIEADAVAFEPLAKAYRIPKDDPERDAVMENALTDACRVPLRIMELCCDAADAVSVIAEKGSRLALSDAGCAATCLRAALQSAYFNVLINTGLMKDVEKASAIREYSSKMLEAYLEICDGIVSSVARKIEES